MTRMLVCGDRKWLKHYLPDGKFDVDRATAIRWGSYRILDQVAKENGVRVLIEGCAPGADELSEDWAHDPRTLGPALVVEHLHFPAHWDKYGRSAGPRRNIEMLDTGRPDFVVALHDNLAESKGTRHMVSIADKAGVPVLGFFWDDALRAYHANR